MAVFIAKVIVMAVWSFLLFANANKCSYAFVPLTGTISHKALPFSPRSLLKMVSIGEACGLSYEEPLFRPPAEWRSLILQVTIGCSWNRCTFCEMYQEKKFSARPIDDIVDEIDAVVMAGGAPYVRDVFLADGDAMTLPTGHLVQILDAITIKFPNLRRVSSYCLPRNIQGKSVEALTSLRQRGLSLVYVGCESGDDTVLAAVNKGETYASSLNALEKLRNSGMKRSVMILLGLGGSDYTIPHALNSAKLCSAAQPEFLSVLTTSFPRGRSRVEDGFRKISESPFVELNPREGLDELKRFLEAIEIPNNRTIFRSDHASNYLVLKGRLGKDKPKLLSQLCDILDAPEEDDEINLRPEWARGL
mmetsp:Transcript_28975/g.38621  ORF Transcript_28975/g.38621 Transcript_28975/m.38621 type:complete len:362 (+) Transcript_28975:37-1122(+)